ncbi:MAG: lactate/malate dehydrogenase family protein [Planctomycetota bacterium]|jgi:L-lactate dehydrogenase|nr:lactate/malate dehydrogenase family protein [Planctomycetota bacterium]
MKVGIIGGGGIVGSSAGFALQLAGIVHEIVIVDANADLADGQALDMLHGTAAIADQSIYAGGYDHLADADLICITAGLRRKPDESRLALINRNVELFKTILGSIQAAGMRPDTTILVVSNPVDILTYLAEKVLGLPKGRVIGLGTLLDTLRFRSLLAMNLKAPATQLDAMIIGEHGDSMVPVWSSASIAGLPLEKWPGFTLKLGEDIFQRAKTSGAEMIKKKTGAGFAVGVSIAEVIHAIALDAKRVLPVSTVLTGAYGLRDVSISVPTVIGRAGAEKIIELELWPKEMQGLKRSGGVLQDTLRQVL